MRVHCPAKVNLHLEIGPRREDGFHELATIFQAVGLWDVLEAEPASTITLACDAAGVPTGEENLVVRAARELQRRFRPRDPGARMVLRKAIPAGGGMGGGSADAAGALVLLSRLWGLAPELEDLEDLAGAIGADVAFFLHGGTAVGTGRGERIAPAPYIGDRAIVLAIPPFSISTGEVYRRHAERRSRGGAPLTPSGFGVTLRGLLTKLGRENDFGPARNDLEQVVLEGWPELGECRRELSAAGARLALVSGSGSTVFGVFDEDDVAGPAAAAIAKRFPRWRTVTVRTVASGVRLEE